MLGSGRVYVGMLAPEAPIVDLIAPELMLRHPDEALGMELDALVVGPGLGQSERAETLVGAALASDIPCVIDADALNLIAGNADLKDACARRKADTLATPHPAEAARLLGVETSEVQQDRHAAAKRLSLSSMRTSC
jgi:NAD(P)H-hydrate repair Nnr-like enzyme with NAD(P)H-hydrate dehydratase domain